MRLVKGYVITLWGVPASEVGGNGMSLGVTLINFIAFVRVA